MKIKFNKEIVLMNKYQIEILLEMNKSINQIKTSMERFTSRMDHVPSTGSGPEDKVEEEIIH